MEDLTLEDRIEVMSDRHLRDTSPLPSDGIIIALTSEVVCAEIVELLRLRLGSILKVPQSAVTCHFTVKGNKISPEIQVDLDKAEGVTAATVQKVIQIVWCGTPPIKLGLRDELEIRLRDLRSERVKEETKKEGENSSTRKEGRDEGFPVSRKADDSDPEATGAKGSRAGAVDADSGG
jgi:hypothetical protein